MDLSGIEDLFSEISEGLLALISGIAIIITVIFFVYAIIPLYGDQNSIVWFSLLSLLVCFLTPVFFRTPDMSTVPDVLGWLMAGITIALFGWMVFHTGYYINFSGLGYIIPSGLLGFASGLPLTEGVLIPLFSGEGLRAFEFSGKSEKDEDEEDFEEEFAEEFKEDEEEEDTFEETGRSKSTFNTQVESDEDDEGPW
ncbi:MAG: hypothetical protein ACLFU5_02045 [Thermoplasmata archaeon]